MSPPPPSGGGDEGKTIKPHPLARALAMRCGDESEAGRRGGGIWKVGVPALAGSQRGPSGPGVDGWVHDAGLKPLTGFRLKAGLRQGCHRRHPVAAVMRVKHSSPTLWRELWRCAAEMSRRPADEAGGYGRSEYRLQPEVSEGLQARLLGGWVRDSGGVCKTSGLCKQRVQGSGFRECFRPEP